MFTKREDELCKRLGWLACHADEDVEHKSEDLKECIDDACDYLEGIGWYDFNANRKEKNNE
jgi:hypothetical protein